MHKASHIQRNFSHQRALKPESLDLFSHQLPHSVSISTSAPRYCTFTCTSGYGGQFSLNHRIMELQGWKGPQEIIKSNPPVKEGSVQLATQVDVQMGLEYHPTRRLHNLSGQPVPVLCYPYLKVLLHVSTELSVFKF